jgi:hypothetical protein
MLIDFDVFPAHVYSVAIYAGLDKLDYVPRI